MKKYIIFLTLFLSFIINGQTTTQKSIDSLWSVTTDKSAYLNKGSKEMLRLCTEIYYQSKNIKYEKGELRALVKMSEIYVNEQNYQESLNKISKGLILSEKTNNNIIYADLLRLQSNVYTQLGYYNKADKSARKTLLIADKITDDSRRSFVKSQAFRKIGENILQENVLKNKYDSVQFYFQSAYLESQKLSLNFPNRNMHIAKNVKNLALVFFYQNKITEAEKYLNQYDELTKNIKMSPEYISYYALKGNIENKRKNYDKALEYFNKSIYFSQKYKLLPLDAIESYSGIAETYRALHDYKNQAHYIEKAKKITDSLSATGKSLVERVSKEEKIENDKTHSLFPIILSITLSIIVIMIAVFFIIKKRRTLKINNENKKGNENIQAVNLVEKQITLTDSQELNHIIELAKNNNPSFQLKFSELFPTFNQKLLEINPQLTPSDLEYCALIKMNFDTKQIATLKKSSIGSVETRKSRMRKKLHINNSENIYTWIMKV